VLFLVPLFVATGTSRKNRIYPWGVNRRAFLYNACCLTGCSLFSAAGQAAASLGAIVYVQKDGLWLRQLSAGMPRLLMRGVDIVKPRFSPSGKWVSCFHGSRLHVLSLAGDQAHVLGCAMDEDDPDAQWSPAGDAVALETKDGIDIFSAENQWGGAIHRIALAGLPLLFSLDGQEIVFADSKEIPGKHGDQDSRRLGRICRLSLQNAQAPRQVLIAENWIYPIPAAWNPRRGEIYFWQDQDFSGSVRADGLELAAISDKGGPAHSLGITTLVFNDMLALSPVQDQLLACDGSDRNTWEQKRIALVNLQTQSKRYLSGKSMAAATPCWSPVGDRIVYAAALAGHTSGGEDARVLMARRRLWIVDLQPESAPTLLTHDPRYRDEAPIWSADGTHILFGRISPDGRKSLWIMTTSGANLQQVTGTLPIYDGHVGASWRSEESWFGYYGHIDWTDAFDWWQRV